MRLTVRSVGVALWLSSRPSLLALTSTMTNVFTLAAHRVLVLPPDRRK